MIDLIIIVAFFALLYGVVVQVVKLVTNVLNGLANIFRR